MRKFSMYPSFLSTLRAQTNKKPSSWWFLFPFFPRFVHGYSFSSSKLQKFRVRLGELEPCENVWESARTHFHDASHQLSLKLSWVTFKVYALIKTLTFHPFFLYQFILSTELIFEMSPRTYVRQMIEKKNCHSSRWFEIEANENVKNRRRRCRVTDWFNALIN